MVILHIAHIGDDNFAGVNVAVPQHVIAQQPFADVGFVNVVNRQIDGIWNQQDFCKRFDIKKLRDPFNTPDLVVFHQIYRPVYLEIARKLSAEKIPYILVPHGELTEIAQRKKWFKKKVANWLLFNQFINKAAAIQCLSEREYSKTHHGLNKFVGTNGIYIRGKKSAFSDSGVRFVYIGRLEINIKGLDLLLEAVAKERDLMIRNKCTVSIYGPSEGKEREKLQNLIGKNNLEPVVSILKEIAGDEKHETLLNADCYIQTSRSEGMSMSILEALGYGIPCVVTDGTNMADLVSQYDAGWACTTTVDGIAAVLRQVIMDRSMFSEKSKHAEALVEDLFCWESVASKTVEQYSEIVKMLRD